MTVFVYEYVTALAASAGPGSALAVSLRAEGRAMLEAACADFRAVPGVTVLTLEADSEAVFRDRAATADYSLVIAPEFDDILETRCRWVEEAGGRLLGPSSAAVRLTGDKLELGRRLRAAHVPTPECWPLGAEPAGAFPFVWKPRCGAGSQATFLVGRPADTEWARATVAAEAYRGEMIAQAFVDGMAASVACLVGPAGTTPLVPCRQLLSEDGRFSYEGGSLPLAEPWAARAAAVATAAVGCVPGLRGYVGVDVVVGETAWVIEINPRLTTSYVGLRALADFNLARALLAAVRGEPWPPPVWKPGPLGFSPSGHVFSPNAPRHDNPGQRPG